MAEYTVSTVQQRSYLRQQWRKLEDSLNENTDIDKWLLDWETIQQKHANLGLHEAEDSLTRFLDAIAFMSPSFHDLWAVRLAYKETEVELPELISWYKLHWSITHGNTGSTQGGNSRVAFSPRQGHQEAKPVNDQLPILDRSCPCSVKSTHKPWECWSAYESDNPAGRKIKPSQKQRREKALKADPAWNNVVEKKRLELEEKTLRQANAASSNEDSGLLSTDPMSTETQYDGPKRFKNRWVISTGAQVHVCNDRKLFITFEETQSNDKHGDAETVIIGVGTVVIYGVSPISGDSIKMQLFNTKYSPNRPTNTISYGLMAKKGAVMNFGNDCIETTDGTPCFKMYQDANLTWLKQPKAD